MRLNVLILLGILVIAAPGHAVQIFSATLDGAQEVPPVVTTATGNATLVLSDDEQSLSYVITIIGLDFASQTPDTGDDVISMHIHNAPLGANGPIVFGMISPSDDTDDLALNFVASTLTATITGVWDSTDSGEDLGDFLDALRAGELYINVHTNREQGGEVRGQIVPEPSTFLLSGVGLIALFWIGKPRARLVRNES